jgi:hypothetical protein
MHEFERSESAFVTNGYDSQKDIDISMIKNGHDARGSDFKHYRFLADQHSTIFTPRID